MGNHYEWTTAGSASFLLTTKQDAPDQLGTIADSEFEGVTAPYALFVGTGDGDGTIIEGSLDEIVAFTNSLHSHVQDQIMARINRALSRGGQT